MAMLRSQKKSTEIKPMKKAKKEGVLTSIKSAFMAKFSSQKDLLESACDSPTPARCDEAVFDGCMDMEEDSAIDARCNEAEFRGFVDMEEKCKKMDCL